MDSHLDFLSPLYGWGVVREPTRRRKEVGREGTGRERREGRDVEQAAARGGEEAENAEIARIRHWRLRG